MPNFAHKVPRAAVGGIVPSPNGAAILLIQRGTAPDKGTWSLPGGKIEFMEPATTAIVREIAEETRIHTQCIALIDCVDILYPATEHFNAAHYIVLDYLCIVPQSSPKIMADVYPIAGTDASQARFVALADLDSYDLSPEIRTVIHKAIQHPRWPK
jgi:8-oxo-dGTP diphosphatase